MPQCESTVLKVYYIRYYYTDYLYQKAILVRFGFGISIFRDLVRILVKKSCRGKAYFGRIFNIDIPTFLN